MVQAMGIGQFPVMRKMDSRPGPHSGQALRGNDGWQGPLIG